MARWVRSELKQARLSENEIGNLSFISQFCISLRQGVVCERGRVGEPCGVSPTSVSVWKCVSVYSWIDATVCASVYVLVHVQCGEKKRKRGLRKPQVVQTKRPVCVSGWGIWMASGGPGGLVVTQVTPEVPGEERTTVCSGGEALKRYFKKKIVNRKIKAICILVFLCSFFFSSFTPPTSEWTLQVNLW